MSESRESLLSVRSRFIRRKRSKLALELLEPRLNLALDVPVFSSLPGANHTIYLDFDGHVTSGTPWNNGATINSPAYSSDADTLNFSASELLVIERTLARVAEDFAPFQVNVTTVEPSINDLRKTSTTDTKWGVRVVVTRDVAFNCGCGGIAYIDSFNWNSDTPAFVFNTSEIGVAEAVSHEVGHALGLSHDGSAAGSYYQGHGLGTDSAYWSSIMGVGYYVDVSHWDNGEYTGSNNASSGANYGKGPNDLAIITNYNGFGYKTDDHGNSPLTATSLVPVGSTITASGLISTQTDVDYFRFTTSGGELNFNFNSAPIGANLDIEASLYDSSGALLASSNPLQSLNANISTVVGAGEYFIKIDGVGAGTPTAPVPTGYTDYASLGEYTIVGNIIAVPGDSLSIGATSAIKNEGVSGSTPFTFTVNRTGNISGTTIVNYSVFGSELNPASETDFVGDVFPSGTLTFAPGITSQLITVDVKGDTTFEEDEGFVVSLQNASADTVIAEGVAFGNILNDDSSTLPPTFGISATNANRLEGTGAATPFVFTITRSGDLTAAASVRYTVKGVGTYKASNNDFVGGFPTNVRVDFAPGVSAVDINIRVRGDSTVEERETFRVTLSSAVGATISTPFANGVIRNDDSNNAANGETEDAPPDLIAVADPLWMFVPAEHLTAAELAVPVMTWINGVPYVGDLAHGSEHGGCGGCGACGSCKATGIESVGAKLSPTLAASASLIVEDASVALSPDVQIVTPLDFESGMQRSNSLLSTTRSTEVELELFSLSEEVELLSKPLDFDSIAELDFGSAVEYSGELDAAFESDLNSFDVALSEPEELLPALKARI